MLAAVATGSEDLALRVLAAAAVGILIYVTGYFDGKRDLAADLLRNRGDNREPRPTT